ncbi:MAG: VWA domain-containing protein, partial [Myxococcota bacterium]
APVNVAIVLDRSGSMQGAKLEAAKEAAIAAIRRLDERDFVSVVAYDSTVQTIWRSQRLTNPQAAERAVRSIRARGNTALFAGVSRGARELRRTWSRDRVNRIVLLSDGLANVGPSSPGALARLGRSLAREGITVTTLGLGLSYNEDLMSQLAAASDGSHAFIEREAELARIFDAEFGDILSVVAQDVNVDVEFVGDARPIRVLGREAYISDGRVRTRLNQIFGEQDKYIVVEVELPPIALDAQRTIAEVSVNYHDLGSRSTRQDRRSVNVTGTDSPAVIEARSNRDVLVIVSDLLAAEEIEQAVALNDQGRIDEAERVLQRSAARLGRDAQRYNSRRLRRRSATQMRAAPELRRRPSRARRALRADQNQAIFNRAY